MRALLLLPIAALSATSLFADPAASNAGGKAAARPAHLRGEASAPVQLEEFGDFECPGCYALFPTLTKLSQDYAGKLCVTFREHPLKKHQFAMDAARAAEAAGLQGHFWEMHDTLYRNREKWMTASFVRPSLYDYAREIGLNIERFKTDIDGDEVARRISTDQERGDSLGVDRTPVIYVNGELISPAQRTESGLRAAIEKALSTRG